MSDNKFLNNWKLQILGTMIIALFMVFTVFFFTVLSERFLSLIWLYPLAILVILWKLFRIRIRNIPFILFWWLYIPFIYATVHVAHIPSLFNYISSEINLVNVYSGIETRKTDDTDTYETREGTKEGYVDETVKGELFKTDDPQFERKIERESVKNEHVKTTGFLFWQTGYAEGYNASHIKQTETLNTGFYNNVQLFISSGIFSSIEVLLYGSIVIFPFLLLYYVYFYFNKELIFTDKEEV